MWLLSFVAERCGIVRWHFSGAQVDLCWPGPVLVSVLWVAGLMFRAFNDAWLIIIVRCVGGSAALHVEKFHWGSGCMGMTVGHCFLHDVFSFPLAGLSDHIALLTGWLRSHISMKSWSESLGHSWLPCLPGHRLGGDFSHRRLREGFYWFQSWLRYRKCPTRLQWVCTINHLASPSPPFNIKGPLSSNEFLFYRCCVRSNQDPHVAHPVVITQWNCPNQTSFWLVNMK